MVIRVRNLWIHRKPRILIWISSLILFILGFQMALRNSSENNRFIDSVPTISNSEQRSMLYDKMGRDLEEKGAVFLEGGETSQSLSLSDMFSLKDGIVTPILRVVTAADPPVRANVLYLSPEFAVPISQAVRSIFLPYFDRVGKVDLAFSFRVVTFVYLSFFLFPYKTAIWFQNSSLYHFSMFHASHHIVDVPASEDEIKAEANAVKAVAELLCPLKIVLDRVLLTSTGVLLGCWQVTLGTDPITIRAHLRNALPRAPEKQLYDPALLHTSFARILGHSKLSSKEKTKDANQLKFFQDLVARLNNQVRGYEAVVSELWYVEEFDVLALALNGRINARRFYLGCSNTT
ncbi:hypothetical protein GIB67_000539 [Kingdonia uniflora]|uniref:Uncharacterized protein n=1 Tax=Kingdonia uniflora TaxID=39325 RepID=A0A7J7MIA5_9MAGN|nr:hypothetical protein GIB67_000539 [Kingdonia uniflora]